MGSDRTWFRIGRLTSATDKVGSLSNTFDERGNVTAESRVVTSVGTLATATAFDANNNVSSITYPSTTVITNTRDTMGRVTAITAKPPGASSAGNVATGITYEPFGPETALTFGNGITGTYQYDQDYRPTSRVDANGATNVMSLAYAYYSNNSTHTITGSNPVVYQYGQAARELLSENDLHSGQTADYIYLNGRPIGEVNPTNGKIYATHTDMLGTPQKLTDSTKATAWSATYQPFGTVSFSGTLTNQSIRLPGKYFDPETTMNHNGFRDYAGGLTRYVESDPIGLLGGA